MALPVGDLRRWRGRNLPLGTNGGPYLYAGDRGPGDLDGPQFIGDQNHLQSRVWVAAHPLAPSTNRRSIATQHWFGNPTSSYIAWSTPGNVARSVYSFRIGYRNGSFWTAGGHRTFIAGYTQWNAVKQWELRQTVDGMAFISGWAGIQASYTGRRPYLRAPGMTDVYTVGNWQMGGNGYYGAATDWIGWIEGRQSADGTLDIRFIRTNGTVEATLTAVLPAAQRSIDTLRFGTVDVTADHVGAESAAWWDFDWFSDAPSSGWPRGPYAPIPARFERVTGPTATKTCTVVGQVDGPPGGRYGDQGVTVRPFTFRYSGERALPGFRRDIPPNYDTNGLTRQVLYRPIATRPGPYRLIVWFHSGFFTQGSPGEIPEAWAAALCGAGYAVVSCGYPLADPPGLFATDYAGKVKHPLQGRYAKRAVWWWQQAGNAATWNVDPARVGVSGYSAGGHLALQIALTRDVTSDLAGANTTMAATWSGSGPDPTVSGAFVYAAPVNWRRLIAEDTTGFIAVRTAQGYMGLSMGESAAAAYNASPHRYVTAGDAPIGYVAASADPLIGVGNMADLQAACQAAGVAFHGATITADHDNVDTVNDPLDPTSGIVPWFDAIYGGPPL